MCISSVFSLVYIVSPSYMLSSVVLLILRYPSRNAAVAYAAPLIFSAFFTSARGMPGLARYMKPMLDYFDYEEAFEITDDELRERGAEGKRYIIATQPHGVVRMPPLGGVSTASIGFSPSFYLSLLPDDSLRLL